MQEMPTCPKVKPLMVLPVVLICGLLLFAQWKIVRFQAQSFKLQGGRQEESASVSTAKEMNIPRTSTNETARVHTNATFHQASATMNSSSQHELLLGILVTTGDIFTLRGWLYRHVDLFERLVVIEDAGETLVDFVRKECALYPQVVVLHQANYSIRRVTDQSVRKIAMASFEKPIIGRWFMVCHTDEYWTVDPREVVEYVSRHEQWANIIRVQVLTASPLESEYLKIVGQYTSRNLSDISSAFDITQASRYTMADHCETVKRHSIEDRFFLWQEGAAWGKMHSIVVPKIMPGGRRIFHADAFHVHFKVHDFSVAAIAEDGRFVASHFGTGLKDRIQEGWRGYFLDQSEPEEFQKFPPKEVSKDVEERCSKLEAPKVKCGVPLDRASRFLRKL